MKNYKNEWVELFTQDVLENPTAYKASVVADPKAAALSIIGDSEDILIREMTRSLRAERRSIQKINDHRAVMAKRCPATV